MSVARSDPETARAGRPWTWPVVFERELRDLWTGGRALVM
jgi:hypothetical protein